MASPRFYSALSALLFMALCAYLGAALYTGLETPRSFISFPPSRSSVELSGIVLRCEENLDEAVAETLSPSDGCRLSPGDFLSLGVGEAAQTAVFFSQSDGFEYLSPADAENLSPRLLSSLLTSEPDSRQGSRIVYGFDFYYAAFISGYDDISPGPCRIKFEGFDESCRAEIISVVSEGGRTALLMRLTQGGSEYLSLRFADAELILPES